MSLHSSEPVKIPAVIEKYYRGDQLTDNELAQAIPVLRDGAEALSNLGLRFNLAFKEANYLLIQFESFLAARNEK